MLREKIEWLMYQYAKCPPIAEVFELQGNYYLYDPGINKLILCRKNQYLIIKCVIEGYVGELDRLWTLYESKEEFEQSLKDVIALIEEENFLKIRKFINNI